MRLWVGDSDTYIFAKELQDNDPLKTETIMSKHALSSGVELWYHISTGKTDQLENVLGLSRASRVDLPAVYTIRDSGQGHVVQQVSSSGPVLYTISSGHEVLLKALLNKSSVHAATVRRYAALWEHQEFLNDSIIMTYVGYINVSLRLYNTSIYPQNDSFNNGTYRYRLYLDEGYRRYGKTCDQVYWVCR